MAEALDDLWDGRWAGNLLPDPAAAMVSPHQFRAAFRNHPAGVALITADAGSGPVAMTASSVISVSAEPPMLVFSLSGMSSGSPTVRRAASLVVHLLGAAQLNLALLGAARGVDRFAERQLWTRLPTGEPYFPSAHARIRGRVVSTMDAGGSAVVAVEALQVHAPEDDGPAASPVEPLVYHNRSWHRLSEDSRIAL